MPTNNGGYNWEARDMAIGYRFGSNTTYKVFDSHDDAEGGSNWEASEYTDNRILWVITMVMEFMLLKMV